MIKTANDHFELVLAAKRDGGRSEELIDAFRPLIGSVARMYHRPGVLDREEFDRIPHRTAADGLGELLARLNERERRVVSGRFGQERTLRELGRDLGVSAERVRQIEQRALDTMRAVVT